MPQRPYRIGEGRTNQARRWPREQTVDKAESLEQASRKQGISERQFAQWHTIPRSTLRQWRARKHRSLEGHSPAVVEFFESSEGLACLHRIVVAAQFSMTQLGSCGIRVLCEFLQLSGLDGFAASSFGSQQQCITAMEQALVEFGQQERDRLLQDMPCSQISVCQDETFHPEICLVAMEPVSNFILVEQYAEKRDAASWNQAMQQALSGLNVQVVQSTSDEAGALIKHVQEQLGAHHSPDTFHVLQDTSRTMSAPLSRNVRGAEQAVNKSPSDPEARQVLERAQTEQEQARQARKDISRAYHPFDLDTGKSRSPEELQGQLCGSFFRLQEIAQQAGVHSVKGLHKAWRVVPAMVATLQFFWQQTHLQIQAWALEPALEKLVYEHWLPGLYLEHAARKAPKAQDRAALQQRAEALLAPVRTRTGPLASVSDELYSRIQRSVTHIVNLFQRSSSCVEGRNGQLSLRHHGRHRFSDRSLKALTVVHNYALRRPDGTTAAQRFFENKPRNLFGYLLDTLEVPRRPVLSQTPSLPIAA